VLSIFREDIKPGKGASHEKLEVGYVRAAERAKHTGYWLGLTPVSGANDAWYVSAFDSFEALEKDRDSVQKNPALISEFERLDEQDAEFRVGQRSIIAMHREDLSVRPGVDIPLMRYFRILTVRVRPGQDANFAEAIKLVRPALEKADPDAHLATYQVIAGMPSGTYFVFFPMKSLKELDSAIDPKREGAVMAAMGEENRTRFQKLLGESIITSESTIYAFSPRMSHVSKEFAARNPDFWSSKEIIAERRSQPRKMAAAKAATKTPQ
jgi:hypothetical protein